MKDIFWICLMILGPVTIQSCTKYYQGPKSENFDGQRFFHKWPQADKNLWTVIKWQLTNSPEEWPRRVENTHRPTFPLNPPMEDISLTFVNHATVFIQHLGLKLITDPHWGERASPVSFAGPKRVRDAGVAIDKLPGLDIVLISHNHYDHFDLSTLKRLKEIYDPLFLVPLGDSYLMEKAGISKFKEMNWWDEVEVGGQGQGRIIFVPVKHWSARGIFDRNKSLWGGYVLLSPTQKIFFAGDTGYCDIFKILHEKYGEFTLSLLPIGAYEPRWFMKDSHMNPEEAVQAHLDLRTRHSMGIHFGLWQLTDEGIGEPIKELQMARKKLNVSESSFFTLEVGQTRIIHDQ